MDKHEVLHIFRVCFLAYLHAEVGSAERDLFEGLAYNWQKYAETRGWHEEVATIITDLFIWR
jgi:hypothetical protein